MAYFIRLKASALILCGWKKVPYFYKLANPELALELQCKKTDGKKFVVSTRIVLVDHTKINNNRFHFNNPVVFRKGVI